MQGFSEPKLLTGTQALRPCFIGILAMWVFDFSPCLLGEGPATPILRQPCLGRVSLSPVRGDGGEHTVSRYFQAFVLWTLSLAIFCVSSENQSSSGHILASVSEQRDRIQLSTELSWPLTLFVLVLLKTVQRPGLCAPQRVSQPSLPGPAHLCPLCF